MLPIWSVKIYNVLVLGMELLCTTSLSSGLHAEVLPLLIRLGLSGCNTSS